MLVVAMMIACQGQWQCWCNDSGGGGHVSASAIVNAIVTATANVIMMVMMVIIRKLGRVERNDACHDVFGDVCNARLGTWQTGFLCKQARALCDVDL